MLADLTRPGDDGQRHRRHAVDLPVRRRGDYWKAKNGCTTTATTYSQGDATCVTHGGCTTGADVVLCTIQGGGHQWPGGDALPFLGKKSDNLNATDALWTFFAAHPRAL